MTHNSANSVALNRQRRLAVQLRLDGVSLNEIKQQANLSAPTIISAHKAYLAGGWPAVDSKARGRQPGAGLLSTELQQTLTSTLHAKLPESVDTEARLWSHRLANTWLAQLGHSLSDRAAVKYFQRWGFDADSNLELARASTEGAAATWYRSDYPALAQQAKKNHESVVWAGVHVDRKHCFFYAHTSRKKLYWLNTSAPLSASACIDFFTRLKRTIGGRIMVVMKGIEIARVTDLQHWLLQNADALTLVIPATNSTPLISTLTSLSTATTSDTDKISNRQSDQLTTENSMTAQTNTATRALTHLQRLEAESIHIMREVLAEADNPVMLYSMGKDSAVMLHLAQKAFFPAKPPFPLLHVDTTWKFRAMYDFREGSAKDAGMELITHVNPQGLEQGVNPFSHGSAIHTDIMKTVALKQALDKYKFDVAFGGARRDEEKSRAKERIFSFRSAQHRWEPKDQRPELWRQYNTRKRPDESIRVFPLSNWTELDIWQYIYSENIPVVPLYLAAERPVVERDGAMIMVDDDRMPLHDGEVPMMRKVRFRTLGCYPLTGAVESTATTLPEVIREMLLTQTSERHGRMIDNDSAASMEMKKQEGYF